MTSVSSADYLLAMLYGTYENGPNPQFSNPAVEFVFGYTGRLYDRETKLQNNLHRWYDPQVGRWLSQDPIGFAAGDANLYRYVGNGTTGATDPSGLAESPFAQRAVNGAVGLYRKYWYEPYMRMDHQGREAAEQARGERRRRQAIAEARIAHIHSQSAGSTIPSEGACRIMAGAVAIEDFAREITAGTPIGGAIVGAESSSGRSFFIGRSISDEELAGNEFSHNLQLWMSTGLGALVGGVYALKYMGRADEAAGLLRDYQRLGPLDQIALHPNDQRALLNAAMNPA